MKANVIKNAAQTNEVNMIVLNEKEMEQVNGGLTVAFGYDEDGNKIIIIRK